MLKRLSDLNYKIDKSGTVTINLGDGGILKASPIEFLVVADEIIKVQSEETRLVTAENIYAQVLKALDIPEELVRQIQSRLHGETPTTETEEISHAQSDEVDEEHKMLYQFVTAFVNPQSHENEFEAEEFSVFDHDIKNLPKILGKYGFDVEIKDGTIIIRLDGESKQNEQQRTDRNPIQRT